jgi:hypothetical protein
MQTVIHCRLPRAKLACFITIDECSSKKPDDLQL